MAFKMHALEIWRKGKSPQAEAKAFLWIVEDGPVTPVSAVSSERRTKIKRPNPVRFVKR